MKILKSGIRDVTASDSATVCEPVNLYECTLHDNVFIGPFVEIQRHCVIGAGTRIQSHSFLCEKVTTGKNCFIGHNVTFANDLFRTGKLNPNAESWISIQLGDNVIVGSGSTILTQRICSGAVIGAGSVVTKDIVKPGIYAGNPARLLREIQLRGEFVARYHYFALACKLAEVLKVPACYFYTVEDDLAEVAAGWYGR